MVKTIVQDDITFSIICPIYNGESFISNAVCSVLSQTYNKWELILIDDGSIDKSSLLCVNFKNKDKRIIFLQQKNKGQFSARINGIAAAHGEYIVFLDSDDTLVREALQTMHDYLKENNDDFLFFNINVIKNNKTFPLFSWSELESIKKDVIYETIINGTTGWSGCKTIKRSLINVNKIKQIIPENYRLTHNEDLLLTCLCLKQSIKVNVIKKCLYNYYVENSSSNKGKPFLDTIKSILFVQNYRFSLLKNYQLKEDDFINANKRITFYRAYSIFKNKLMTNQEKRFYLKYYYDDFLFLKLMNVWEKSRKSFKERLKTFGYNMWYKRTKSK